MRSDITLMCLEDAVEALIDYRGKTPKKTTSGVPLITAKVIKNGEILEPNEFIAPENYDSWMVRGLPKVGDVVLTVEAPLGQVAQLTESYVALAQRVVTLRGKEGVLDNTYLKYLLMTSKMQAALDGRSSGSTVKGIKQSELRKVELELPDIGTQRKVASILASLDNKIANNKAMNQTLEKLAQRIFKSWFIDFDPVKANKEGLPFDGLSPEIQALFPSEFEDSELGMIPKGWAAEELSSLININPRRTIKKGTVTHHIDMKALPTSSMSIDEVGSKEFKSGTKFINHDTLLARITPCLENGKTAYVNCIPGNDIAWGSTEFIVMNPKDEYLREYTYLLARSDELRAYAIKNMTGTSGRQRVSGTLVGEFKVSKPNQAVLKAFHKVTASLFMKIATNTENSVALEKIRDRLLPKLISGQISVGEAAQELAEAV
ncbi:restriction endonuclease subunit S [Vibrio parahaemolyticus]|uniref:restriction endonuclease subunit S n=1 Tax=Vibrio TaxID=662 RepID=UPI0011238D8E|nr:MULTISPECIES: restriction endonuclease subunit S [Vibrio]MDW1968060.1 restriction endonuclease subunit S [Vibrio sp. Vb0587]TOB04585.1 restriction endonuclease subunit S [Vibrio parahaemolyticus]HAV1574287.1 restriction endonuclease subunit S [Vibrio parahaemolyticus]HAV1982631.1 restriction endonuclease subunit S [Vibrio parahaemolyticus]